jgi:hypothetical protein
MTTPLTKPLKRELQIQGRPFVVTLSAEGIKLVLKGKRKGQELRWEDLVSGEAALAVALNASLRAIPAPGGAAQAEAPGNGQHLSASTEPDESPGPADHAGSHESPVHSERSGSHNRGRSPVKKRSSGRGTKAAHPKRRR